MNRYRDTQKSRVYAWERKFNGRTMFTGTMTIEECEEMVKRIWRSERGRIGLAKVPAPAILAGRGASGGKQKITLGRWARNPWVVLHEMAHGLAGRDTGGWHGPRFVGVLIGLAARHLDADAQELMALADEMGVKYYVRSIGCVPVKSKVALLESIAPVHEVEAAIELGLHWRQVRGVVLSSCGALRMRGRTVVANKEAA